ncbi:MAG TPA: methyltransferase domain-containing protein [Gaiellales bacterium]|nr:methyltransferase domain-containing protein [Gaiellales bacterium]
MFEVAADSYDRFMGRYSGPLAANFIAFAGVQPGWRVLDVGAGPGALTSALVDMLGAGSVAAADPSPPFVEANRERHPGVDVRLAGAEDMPFADGAFDAALAQLVVQFMSDPVRGVSEMARVTRPGGVVAACVWDFGTGRSPLSAIWGVAAEMDPSVEDEGDRVGVRPGQLADVFERAGLDAVEESEVSVTVEHESFDAWWQPMTFGVGPAGAWLARQPPEIQDRVRERCRDLYPDAPGIRTAVAWAARGRAAPR